MLLLADVTALPATERARELLQKDIKVKMEVDEKEWRDEKEVSVEREKDSGGEGLGDRDERDGEGKIMYF